MTINSKFRVNNLDRVWIWSKQILWAYKLMEENNAAAVRRFAFLPQDEKNENMQFLE